MQLEHYKRVCVIWKEMFCLEPYEITLYIQTEMSNFSSLFRWILTNFQAPAVRDHTDKTGTLRWKHLLHIYTGGSLLMSPFFI